MTYLKCLVWVFLVTAAGCASSSDSGEITRGDLRVALSASAGLVITQGERVVLASQTSVTSGDSNRAGDVHSPFAASETLNRDLSEQYGYYLFEDSLSPYAALKIARVKTEPSRLTFEFAAGGGGSLTVEGDHIRIRWSYGNKTQERLSMNFKCESEDRFFGLGAHISVEHRGYSIPIWVAEQGHGKVERDEVTPVFFLVGDHYTSYNPVPFALMNRPLGIHLDTTERSHFELCDNNDDLRVEIEGSAFEMVVFAGETMADVLTRFTAETGRVEVPPRWNFAPVIDAGGGPDKVREIAQLAREEGIPASAIWVEDWVGVQQAAGGEHLHYNWEVDTEMYPNFSALTEEMATLGLRFLTYVSPYVPSDTNAAQAGLEGGYLIRDSRGEPVVIEYPWGAPPYYFNVFAEDAKDWFKTFVARADALGIDGWMADFGEALPYDAQLGDGRTGKETHNDYPRQWTGTNLDTWKSLRPDDDFMLFTRSGYTGTAARTRIHWLGDQMSSFDRNDGFGSVIPLYISAGLSGIPLTHSDVGGYATTIGHTRTFELWARWLQLEAFTPILRTHHGSNPERVVQWYSTPESLSLFKRYAQWHQRLLPYFMHLTEVAAATGIPTCRPIWWGSEERSDLYQIETELLVGKHLLVAPILEEGATARDVIFPSANWSRWIAFDSPIETPLTTAQATVAAELTEPILFIGPGAAVPMLTEDYDVMAPARGIEILPSVNDAPKSITSLMFLLTPGGESQGTLDNVTFGATEWRWEAPTAAVLSVEAASLNGDVMPTCATATDADCVIDETSLRFQSNGLQDHVVAFNGAEFRFKSDTVEEVVVRVR